MSANTIRDIGSQILELEQALEDLRATNEKAASDIALRIRELEATCENLVFQRAIKLTRNMFCEFEELAPDVLVGALQYIKSAITNQDPKVNIWRSNGKNTIKTINSDPIHPNLSNTQESTDESPDQQPIDMISDDPTLEAEFQELNKDAASPALHVIEQAQEEIETSTNSASSENQAVAQDKAAPKERKKLKTYLEEKYFEKILEN